MTRSQLPWTEMPQATAARAAADEQLRESLAALDGAARIDLFNLVRFPKSNVVQTARMIEALRDHYFSGANFHDVITGMNGHPRLLDHAPFPRRPARHLSHVQDDHG